MVHSNRVNAQMASDGGHFHVVVGVCGGIAAYKTCTLVRLLVKAGIKVTVVPTTAALDMVGQTTWEALSGNPIVGGLTENASNVSHVTLGQQADLIVIAPTTAHTIAKIRGGLGDNSLTAMVLAARCPVMLFPAMHTEMWLNQATQENVAVLKDRGIDVIEPDSGRLTGPDSGPGRLPEPEAIFARVQEVLVPGDLAGCHIVISGGGTREEIDPVRFIGNHSTGEFAAALSSEARRRGGSVQLVAANLAQDVSSKARANTVESVVSTEQMAGAMYEAAKSADVVVMAAAIADYKPLEAAATKMKKDESGKLVIELTENPDILVNLVQNRRNNGQIIVGFAAETGDKHASADAYGRAKAIRKGADLMVINEIGVSKGFGAVETAVTIVNSAGETVETGAGSKVAVAGVILDAIANLWLERRIVG